jgi:hypothetical protein
MREARLGDDLGGLGVELLQDTNIEVAEISLPILRHIRDGALQASRM